MKKYLLLLILGLVCNTTIFSQSFQIISHFDECVVPNDIDLSKIYVKPFEQVSKNNILLSSTDTLNDHYLRATEFLTYAVNIQGNNFPLTGTNPIYYFLGEKFPVNTSGSIEGILIAVSFKVVGTFQDTLIVSVYNSNNENGLPEGAPIWNEFFFLENLDTNLTAPKFSYIDFTNPVNYSGPFVVMVLTRSIRVNNNGYVVFSNKHGDGANQERCCVLIYTQNGWVSTNLGNVIQLEGVPIDIDPMIIPIVSSDISGLDENIIIGSLSIKKLLVNNDQTNLKTLLSSSQTLPNLIISVVDVNGNVVIEKIFNNFTADLENELNLDISNLITGSYFFMINSGKDKIATKFNIVR